MYSSNIRLSVDKVIATNHLSLYPDFFCHVFLAFLLLPARNICKFMFCIFIHMIKVVKMHESCLFAGRASICITRKINADWNLRADSILTANLRIFRISYVSPDAIQTSAGVLTFDDFSAFANAYVSKGDVLAKFERYEETKKVMTK